MWLGLAEGNQRKDVAAGAKQDIELGKGRGAGEGGGVLSGRSGSMRGYRTSLGIGF